MAKVLYITYDGLMEPLGSSQVLNYLLRLSDRHDITLVSYEKREDWGDRVRRDAMSRTLADARIRWVPLRYHKRPSAIATAWDVLSGCAVALALAATGRVDIVHSRSYVASIPALFLKRTLKTRFLFDMRGFWADERAERSGLPKSSPLYRAAKWFEERFFRHADLVVSLTHAGVAAIKELPYLEGRAPRCEVIPTCTDLDRFRLAPGSGGPFTLGYVGSADTAYMFEPVLRCFKVLRDKRPDARLLVLTRSSHDYVRSLLPQFGIPTGALEIKSARPEEVAAEMARMDAGIFFVKPGFSTCASVPTKLGEFLGCGVPCLGNAGIGDLEGILEGESVGVILRDFSPEAEADAVDRLLALCAESGIGSRCAGVARRFFSLEEGVRAYHGIYGALEKG